MEGGAARRRGAARPEGGEAPPAAGWPAHRLTCLRPRCSTPAGAHHAAPSGTPPTLQIRRHHSPHEYRLVFRFYWPRLMAVCLTWGLSNFAVRGRQQAQGRVGGA